MFGLMVGAGLRGGRSGAVVLGNLAQHGRRHKWCNCGCGAKATKNAWCGSRRVGTRCWMHGWPYAPKRKMTILSQPTPTWHHQGWHSILAWPLHCPTTLAAPQSGHQLRHTFAAPVGRPTDADREHFQVVRSRICDHNPTLYPGADPNLREAFQVAMVQIDNKAQQEIAASNL